MIYYQIELFDKSKKVKTVCTDSSFSQWKPETPEGRKNYEDLGKSLGIDPLRMVRLKQTHSSGIKVVTEKDGGLMVCDGVETVGFDGMVTNARNILLCTLEADCVPVFFFDPTKNAIGMVHSGWRGTASKISKNAVVTMQKEYGSNPEDILAAVGPHICGKCYEVGEELIPEFNKLYSEEQTEGFFAPVSNGKYRLDMKKAIAVSLTECGIKCENIIDTGICTYENTHFCSWRRDKVRNHMLTGIMLL